MERVCGVALLWGYQSSGSAVWWSLTEGPVKEVVVERLEVVTVIRSSNEVLLQLERSHEN